MLGWEIFISRKVAEGAPDEAHRDALLATWLVGIDGVRWLDDLVGAGQAEDLGGNGYPIRYAATAGVLAAALRAGVPGHDSPAVIGDDYSLPRGWTGKARCDIDRMRALDPTEVLSIEAWDQS